MNILLTNDDGVNAAGLTALAQNLREKHAVTVAAPLSEMSGVSHAFTLFSPLTVEDRTSPGGIPTFAIRGTPSDCVKVAVTRLCKRPPDLLISGINPGENTGVSSFYSGTVAAAREGLFFGIKSLAVSLADASSEGLAYAVAWTARLIEKIVDGTVAYDGKTTFLNVNFPPCPPQKIAGTRFTRQGVTPFDDRYEEKAGEDGAQGLWLTGKRATPGTDGDDDRAIADRYIAVTPLTIDMTDHPFLERQRHHGAPIL